ncbi:MAG: hypothetical protein IKI15_04165 [Lachnospiraceae bacterium]|nr:hypothetical protein [Lachnospiraceae bacterium]
MKGQKFRLIAVLCVLAMMMSLLAACEGSGTKEREKKSESQVTDKPETTPTGELTPSGDPTPTSEVTPTAEPTAEPTATPTAEPTAEPTATPTAEPTAEPTAAPTGAVTMKEQKCGNGSFSAMIPADATVDIEARGFWAKTDEYYFDAWYIDTVLDGAVYNVADLMTMINGENTMIDLLAAGYYDKRGEYTRKTINGVDAVVGPDADIMVTDDAGTNTQTMYTRFIAYDSTYEYGLIVVSYSLFNVTCDTMTDEARELDKMLMACAESVQQYFSPVNYTLDHYAEKIGSIPVEFLCVSGDIKETERGDKNELVIKPYGTQNVLITLEEVPITATVTDSWSLYDVMKATYGNQAEFSELGDAIEREGYHWWDMRYDKDGERYTDRFYCTEAFEQNTLLLIRWTFPTNADEVAEALFNDMLWSLKLN